jgi:hypothetical protein
MTGRKFRESTLCVEQVIDDRPLECFDFQASPDILTIEGIRTGVIGDVFWMYQ